MRNGSSLAMILVLLSPGSGLALDPDVRCRASKIGSAAKYASCRLKEESKALKTGGAADVAKCDAKFTADWQKIESVGGAECPTSGDGDAIRTLLGTAAASTVAGTAVDGCIDNTACGAGNYCEKGTNNCGGAGTCTFRPNPCLPSFAPVCGCNVVTYSNACEAHKAGVSVLVSGSCF